MIEQYLKKILSITKKGDAREESYYPALASLVEDYARETKRGRVNITMLPKRTSGGNPDFRIWDGRQHIIGYIEAKTIHEENLDRVEESEQLQRYRSAFPNLLLTNFHEFRLYRDGQLIDRVQIARPVVINQLRMTPPVENKDAFLNLLEKFFTFSLPRTYTPKTLAQALARRTHYLREQVLLEFGKEHTRLKGFYEAFAQHLISGLTPEDFADMYAQTITYGLFAASSRGNGGFNRRLAFDNIPRTIGILRDVFRFVLLEEPGAELAWIIDDIVDVLTVANTREVLHKYFVEGKGSDPIVHFYETFLAEYDPKEREQRGVYYTPPEVVSYIVRSLNIILMEYFGKQDGFATSSVTVLDPAAGTLTFLAEAAKVAANEFAVRYGAGGINDLIRKHILENYYAFELMMAPYVVGHMKMGFLLDELGYKLGEDDRFKLYLTNTLDMKELAESSLPGMSSLSEESHAAGKVKKDTPILVILGNPPYSGHSANKGDWIRKEIKEYYKVDGKDLDEKNPKWLQDDYVKFIRFAQWKIDQAGEGALGFITNHAYLDNPTFRGMRCSLMNSFDHICILDLHGNSKKKEKCPDGSKDENVFDIQQGVAIILAVKKPGLRKKIVHADCWGLRVTKCDWLIKNDLKTTKWQKLSPKGETYFFVPKEEKGLADYERYPKITDIFPVNSVGVVTSRDEFTIGFTKDDVKNKVRMFIDENIPDGIIRSTFGLQDKTNWKLKDARRKVRNDEDWEKKVIPILYRPFDQQWIFYAEPVIERTRQEVMRNMMQKNLSLCVGRAGQVVGIDKPWNVVFCSDCIGDLNLFYRGGNVNFPLYVYPECNLYNGGAKYQREINIAPKILEAIEEAYGERPSPENILYYIYAVLYSKTYRIKYGEFLKTDFPRIPFCEDYKLFRSAAKLGRQLVELHLMKSDKLDKPATKFEVKGDNTVKQVTYEEGKKTVRINAEQRFIPVPAEVWEYQIGGYQVMEKWLKDRKGRRLSLDEIKQYCRIATALKETIVLQGKFDEIYELIEKKCVKS
ncbi:MAG: N-6 DNA methylase [Sedimentisphaerales bacterium]|nr:N-6 DNA methylase [Sedimentisphaerales bacterium]